MKSGVKIGLLVVCALALLAGAFALVGVSPAQALSTLWSSNFGALGDAPGPSRPVAISGLLREMMPLLFLGAAVFLALRAGLFNIGAEGQFLVGGIAAAAVALSVPGAAGMLLAIGTAMLVGAIWAFPAAWIKAYRNGHEVITTIMMNQIAVYVTTVLVAGVLKDKEQESTTTAVLNAGSRLGALPIGGVTINYAILLALALVVTGAYWFKRSVGGFEVKAVGGNPTAAKFAGIKAPRVQFRAMMVSGAISGLAGALQVVATEGRYYAGFSPGYGFDALGVALLAGNSMLGVIPAALGFGMLNKASTALTIEGVPKGITGVVLGLLIVIFAAIRYRKAVAHE